MNAGQALWFLDILRGNYLDLARQKDPEFMPLEVLEPYERHGSFPSSLLTAAWFGRQGGIVSVWSLWEVYSTTICTPLPNQVKRKRGESHVEWVGRTLTANSWQFACQDWFEGGNALRNLITHHHCRVRGQRATDLMAEARRHAFPQLTAAPNDYVNLESDHVSEYFWKIAEFIRDPGQPDT